MRLESPKVSAHLLLGTNLGDRSDNLARCLQGIGHLARIAVSSQVYLTEAWGMKNQPDFYNQAIEVESELSAHQLLGKLQDLELEIGRVRNVKWESRIIDIDILFYGSWFVILTNYDCLILYSPNEILHWCPSSRLHR